MRARLSRILFGALLPVLASAQVAAPVDAPAPTTQQGTEAVPGSGTKEYPPVSVADQQRAFLTNVPNVVIDDPVDDSRSRFDISTTTDSSRAGIRLNVPQEECPWGAPSSNKDPQPGSCKLSVALSAPINKAGPDTNIATLSGFANASTLAFDFAHYSVTRRWPSADEIDAFAAKMHLDDAVLGKKNSGDKPDVDLDALHEALKKAGKLDHYDEALALFFDPNAARWNWGANATIGYESDDYFNPATLAAQNRKAEPWSLGLYAGFFPLSGLYVSGAFDLAHAYKAAKTQTLCPTGSGGVVECVTGSFGPPKETDKHLLSLGARTEIAKVGLALKLTHDTKSGDSGADLPIYLFSDSKHALNGGLRLGWTNTDHFSAGVFVGSTFDGFGN